jgi:hypothetical protein
VHVPGGVVGGGGRCLLCRWVEAAAGAAAAAAEVVPGAGIPGALTTSSGGDGSVRTWGWTKPGGTGRRRQIVAEEGEGGYGGSGDGGGTRVDRGGGEGAQRRRHWAVCVPEGTGRSR